MRHAVSDWTSRYEDPFVFYFHVWELDPEQPKISAASRYNRIRHYRKLDKMEWIIRENLELYDFSDIAEYLDIKESLMVENLETKVENLATQNPIPKKGYRTTVDFVRPRPENDHHSVMPKNVLGRK